jgi:hypothetical protein
MSELSAKSVVNFTLSPTQASATSSAKARQVAEIKELRRALLAAGFVSLDRQAAALGLSRSTTWHVLCGNHKSSGLSASVIERMLSFPCLPPEARKVVEEYLQEKLAGTYGHRKERLRIFRMRVASLFNAGRSDPLAAVFATIRAKTGRHSTAP